MANIDYEALVLAMKKGLHICDRTWWFTTYPHCFIGSDCVTWLLNNQNKICETRDDAIQIGQQLAARNFIKHVKSRHNFKDDYLFYVFCDREQLTSLGHAQNTSNNKPSYIATSGITGKPTHKTHASSTQSTGDTATTPNKSNKPNLNLDHELAAASPLHHHRSKHAKSGKSEQGQGQSTRQRFNFWSMSPMTMTKNTARFSTHHHTHSSSSSVFMAATKSAPIIPQAHAHAQQKNRSKIANKRQRFAASKALTLDISETAHGHPRQQRAQTAKHRHYHRNVSITSSAKSPILWDDDDDDDDGNEDELAHTLNDIEYEHWMRLYLNDQYQRYVPRFKHNSSHDDGVETVLCTSSTSTSCSLPKYLSTNIYAMHVMHELDMTFVASTSFRPNWKHSHHHHHQHKDEKAMLLHHAYIYVLFREQWTTVSWPSHLRAYLNHAMELNIIAVHGAQVLNDYYVLWVTWSHAVSVSTATQTAYKYFLSTVCWKRTDLDAHMRTERDIRRVVSSLFDNMSITPLDFIPFCLKSTSMFSADEPLLFIGGKDGVHCFECKLNAHQNQMQIEMMEIENKAKHPLSELKNMKNAVLAMDLYQCESAEVPTVYAIVGCQDGYIKLLQKTQITPPAWTTNRRYSKHINGPISSLLFYREPNMFDHYLLSYEYNQLYMGATSDAFVEPLSPQQLTHAVFDVNEAENDGSTSSAPATDALCVFIGCCTGLGVTYSSLNAIASGCMSANCEYLFDTDSSSCDSILCAHALTISGYLFLLCGRFSGKLHCYRMSETHQKTTRKHYTLVCESQFDQQIYCIQSLKNGQHGEAIVLTMNKIYFVCIKISQSSIVIDRCKCVSV